MADFLGWAFLATFIPCYVFCGAQIRDSWIRNKRNDMSVLLALFGAMNSVTFPLYAAIQRPPEWASTIAMSIFAVQWSILVVQRWEGKPRAHLLSFAALLILVSWMSPLVGLSVRNVTSSMVNFAGLISSIVGILAALPGPGAQIWKERILLKMGRVPEMSFRFYSATFLSYIMGLAFGLASNQPWLAAMEFVGALLWGLCIAQRLILKPTPAPEPA